MWLSKSLVSLVEISKDTVNSLRIELAAVSAERRLLTEQLHKAEITSDWLRMKVNQLEYERAALMEKAYNIHIPTPEIARQPTIDPTFDPKNFSFEDVGEVAAKTLGLPTFN
jgi:hypothetical protein